MLLLAQTLKGDRRPYRSMPTEPEAKRTFALKQYAELMDRHMKWEEKTLIPWVEERTGELVPMHERIASDHRAIREAFGLLGDVDPSDLVGFMNRLGHLMEKHIRFEEREWFEAIQATVDDLDALPEAH